MATSTSKVLGQSAPATTTLTALYTVPTAYSTVCSTILVCNRSASADSFRILIAVAGAALDDKQYLYYNVTIPGNETFVATVGITISAGDIVKCYSTNGTCSFSLFGIEKG